MRSNFHMLAELGWCCIVCVKSVMKYDELKYELLTVSSFKWLCRSGSTIEISLSKR